MSEELTKQLQRLARSLDQRHASGLSLPRVLLVDVARQLRAAADLIESQQARIEELEASVAEFSPALLRACRQRDTYEAILRDFVSGDDPCSDYDHHGYCQTHGWFETNPRCPYERAADEFALLAASPDTPETRP